MSTLGVDENSQGEKVQKEKKNNVLPLWGNERSMNLNPLILTNIQSSHYFKVNLYELKTYHEVIDEIYYKVTHLEPWEKGSRKTAGQTGMCGGVRGVGAGGIVSTAYCLLYKLFTLKLTRKQVNGLLTHPDSPYIRALGFMYIRYTQPPADLWDWYDEYLEDTEDMDVKAGGGHVMTIGDMLRHFLTKLEWFSTLFPRIPVPIQQKLERQLGARFPALPATVVQQAQPQQQQQPPVQPVQPPARGGRPPPRDDDYGEQERLSRLRRSDGEGRSPSQQGRSPRDSPSYRGEKRSSRPSSPSRSSKHARYDSPRPRFDREPSPRRDYEPEYRHSERYDRDYKRSERSNSYGGGGSSSRDRERGHRSHRTEESSSRHRHKEKDFASELARERERQQQRREKSRERERTGSRRS